MLRRGKVLDERIGPEARRRVWRRNAAGIAPYAAAVALAAVSSYATLTLCGLLAVYYALPATTAREPA